ncbi:aspartyl protease family protein [Dokdonia sp.]|uniref:aspartyl protease family protein n=1 Tax=Dokdonia sp. TaxID=2024995 RepID=UPI00326491B3
MKYFLFFIFIGIYTTTTGQIASIPFIEDGLVYIPVTVPGEEETLQFVFDTGASTAVLDKSIATRLGIEADTKQYATGASGSQEYEIAIHRTLEIADIRFDKLNLVLVDLQELSNRSGVRIDGIIGYDVIKEYITQFDFAAQKIHLHKNINDINTQDFSLHPIQINSAIPLVTIDCTLKNGKTISGEFLFDSGANLTVLFNTPYAKKHQLKDKVDKTVVITARGLTSTSNSTIGTLAGATLLGYNFEELPISISQATHGVSSQKNFAGILGAKIINRFDMILDYKNKNIYLKPNARYKDAFEMPLVGFALRKVDNKIIIADVIKDTEAAQNDITENDEVVSINGISHTTLKKYRDLLKKEGETIRIIVKKASGEQKEITLTLQRLI